MISKILAATLITFGTSMAFAEVHVEPGLTYESGDNKYQWPSPLNDSTGDSKGVGFNLKLGGNLNDMLFLVADGSYSKPDFTNSANNYDAEATSTLFGMTLGAQMPIVGLRIWGGYIFDGTLDPEASNGFDVKFEGANGVKLGVGFKVFMVSLNLEYLDLKYKDTTIEAGSFTSTPDGELENKLTVLSVSFPLAL